MTGEQIEVEDDAAVTREVSLAASVVIPMRNEAEYIADLVADLAAQDMEEPFDVIFADGGSTDGSVELLRSAGEQAGLRLRIVDNPRRNAAAGLNVCVAEATGEIVVRLDCHTRYPADYVRRCVAAVRETGAWNAAGVFSAIGRTWTERAIATALDSPFGGHNWTRKLLAGRRIEVDTNYLGAFPREALAQVGPFDEHVGVCEVEDLNLRLRQAGGTIVLDPDITSFYFPRPSFRSLFRQYYRYGFWKVALLAKHRQVISGRSVVPLVFVAGTTALVVASFFSRVALWLLAAEAVAYVLGAIGFGAVAVAKRRESFSLLPGVLLSFVTFHVAHGLGQIHGLLALPVRRLRRR